MIALVVAAALGWLSGAPMPEARTEVAAAVVRGEIALVGGLTTSGAPSPRVDAYSPEADHWRRLPDLPAGRHHALAASDGRALYVVGGYGDPLGGGGPTRTAWILEGGAWHGLPRSRSRARPGAPQSSAGSSTSSAAEGPSASRGTPSHSTSPRAAGG